MVRGFCDREQNVGVTGVEPVGNYALRLLFDDGHNTGLYTWNLLHELGRTASELVPLPRALRRAQNTNRGPLRRTWTPGRLQCRLN